MSAADPVPLPAGFRIELDVFTRQLEPGLWFGGSPARIIRLTSAGQQAWRELEAGPVASRASGLLARRLTDAGLAHPVPPPDGHAGLDLTVIVPAYDRADLLDRCLAGLGTRFPVVVVDDGSRDPDAVAGAAARYGATLIRRGTNGGPGAARNTALQMITTELIAFVDSDCVPTPGWIEPLAAHFADPLVAAAAPRIIGLATATSAGRYNSAAGALDLGGRPARVMPRTHVAYVPTAALLVRRAALQAVARAGSAGQTSQMFDEAMSIGEDVDLIWRLHEAGWRIRYDPAVRVAHHEPATWPRLLARRYRYGTSAAPLALRHPGDVVHLALQPWPTASVAAALARRPAAAATAFAASVITMHRTLRRSGVPRRGTLRAMLTAVEQTWLGVGRYGTQFLAPVLAVAIAAPGGTSAATRRGRRVAACSLLLGPALRAWASNRNALDPARFVLGRIADDVAYGVGVWTGCIASRTSAPLRPVISWHPVRIDPAAPNEKEGPRR